MGVAHIYSHTHTHGYINCAKIVIIMHPFRSFSHISDIHIHTHTCTSFRCIKTTHSPEHNPSVSTPTWPPCITALLCSPFLNKKEWLTDREQEDRMKEGGNIPQQEDRGAEEKLSALLHLCRSLFISPHGNGCSLPLALTLVSVPPLSLSLYILCVCVCVCVHVRVWEKNDAEWRVTDPRPSVQSML